MGTRKLNKTKRLYNNEIMVKRLLKKSGLFALFMLIAVSGTMYAQEKRSKRELRQEQTELVQRVIEAQDYKFMAQQALPMSGRSVQLTSDYDLRVSRDTVSAYLPYYGRAYVAPMDPSEGGIKFESTDFTYTLENAKKGGWIINITINDAKRRIKLILNVSTGGSATLSAMDDTRQNISFNGYVEERKDNYPRNKTKK